MANSYSKKANRPLSWAVAILILFALPVNSQVITDYAFNANAGNYATLTGATAPPLTAGSLDDGYYNNLPLGFSFCYNGQTYTSFHTSTNGWGSFLPLTANTLGNNLTTGGTPRPVIAPLWDDLEVNPAGEFRYMTTGSAGSQVFTAEWFLMQWNFTAATPVISFQVKIYEGTNVIEFVYRPEAGANTNPSASVGITATGVGSGNFLSVDSLTTTAIVSSTTETTTIGNMPSAGLLFTFTPPAPPASPINLTFTAVTASGMTLNWEDNSTNENTFTVWRSLDNVNYTQVTTITSTTQATTGNPYSYVATGLFTNTLYYWRVFAVNAGCSNAPLTGQQSTLSGTLCGTFTVGPTGAYTSLTAAIADVQANGVQCPLIFELQAAYVCTVETFPLVVPFLGTGPTTSITVRPEMGADSLIISSSAIVTIDMSGATYFVFDGRPGGVGTAIELTIADSSTTGIAARFINDAQNSGYMFCKIRGNNTATTSGVIVFSTALTAGANSNNSITDCEIFDFISTPVNLVYASNATAATFNSGNIFSNNLFHDWYLGTAANMAMNIAAGNTGWTITNNSFYQTATRNYTTGTTHVVINANSGSATATGNFTINGNSIGGTAPGAGGTPWTITGAVISRFIGIQTNTGTGGTNNIQGNTITNFNFSSSSTTATANGIWCGINMIGTSGSNNTGTVTPNIIGSTATDSAIVTTTTGTGGLTIGINSSASGANVISNNQIGGFTALSGSATTSTNIMGIQTTAGNVTISGNVIGSTGVANSMMNAPSTGTTAGQVTGIVSTVTVSSSITGNTIVNLTNRYAGTSTIGQTRGIATTSSTNTINGNIISNLASTSGVVSATSPVVVGIAQTSTTANANQTISNNTITNLASSSASTNVSMVGIYYNGPATGTNRIFNNNISGIGAPLNIGNPVISGIYVNAGVSRFYNNMILLGVDASGNPITQAHEYNGIIKVTTANNNFFYNTVHIDGSGVFSGTANTYSFRRTSATGTDSLYNNVLTNFRSNASGGGAHYSLGMANTTTFASDYNNFFGTGSGYSHAIVGTTVYPTLASWTAALSLDQLSYSVSPDYISATDLHINNTSPSLLESRALAISGITFDIDNDVRPGPVGSVNGGGVAPDIGADEFDGIPVQVDVGVQTLLLPLTTGCHGASDTVRVRVLNFTPFAVNMSADPLMIVSYTQGANPQSFPNLVISSGTIPAGGTLDTIVSTTYNMTAAGIHTFFAYTNVTADVVNSNDSLQPVSILISGGTYVAPNNGEICIGSPTTLNVTGFTNGGTVQWEESPDNVTWTPIAGATTASFSLTPSDTTFYRAVICGIHNSSVDTVFPELVPPAITTDTIRCGPGPVTLTASGTGFLNWYDQPSGGSLVNTGPTFSSSVINTDTFYVENASDPPAILTTTFAGGNSFFGNMFAVTALSNITITSFDGNVDATADYEIWYMQNDYNTVAGATSSNAAWTFIGNATGVPSNGTGIATPIPIPVNITIPAGQTYSFYITILAGTMNYTNGTVLGNVFASNADLQFREGHGGAYFNLVNSPRVWNGNIHYLSGCISATRTPLIVEVTPSPIISTTAADSIVCDGGSTVLSVSSPNPDYSFTWSPAANLSTTTGSSTVFTPTTPGTYTYFIDANDTATACLNRDTIVVEMELNPTVIASVSNDSICPGTSVNLNAVANLRVYKPDTANTANTTMTYPAPYGNWFWGAKHQMLVLASELQAANVPAGPIEGLSFFVTTVNTVPLFNFDIRMAPTALTSLPTGTFQSAGFTTVYSVPGYIPTTGENFHLFGTPFIWNGTDNVIIETCFNDFSFTTNCIMELVTKPFVATTFFFQDATGVCAQTTPNGNANSRPVMNFYGPNTRLTYDWTPVTWLSDPTIPNPVATPMATVNYVISITDTISGCGAMDSVTVTQLPSPSPDFGPDTSICSNTTLLLDATAGPYTYVWQDMSVNQTYTVNLPGTYYADVTDTTSGCSASDTITVGIDAAPLFTLGSDVTICADATATFTGPAGAYDYLWNTGDTTQSITTGTGGTYVLTVSDQGNACAESDTVVLNVNPLPPVALGSDTSVCSAGLPYTLSGPAGNYSYLWSNMSTGQTLNVTSSGVFYVTVTDNSTGCVESDTVSVLINTSPVVTLGNDTTFCSANGPITLVATPGPYNYLWSDMSTGSTLTTNTTGLYYVTVTDPTNGCAAMDSIMINVPATPVVALADTSVCGSTYVLSAPSGPYSYNWSTGATSQSIIVTPPGGTFTVTVTDNNSSCAASDVVTVSVNLSPVITFNMQATACTTDPAFTLVATPSGGTFSGTGVSGNTYNPAIAGAGTFTVVYNYTDANGCQGSGSDVIIVDPCVGVTDPAITAGMEVFPNPNNGSFTLFIADAGTEMTVEMTTIEGQVIYSDKVSTAKGPYRKDLSLGARANGIYFLRVTIDGTVHVQKIVKNQ